MNYKKFFAHRLVLTVIAATIIFFIIKIISSFFYVIDDAIRDFTIVFKNQTYNIDHTQTNINQDIVFVTIDEKTISELHFPMSRRRYIPVIENLNSAGAQVIGFDIIFSNISGIDPDGDTAFIQAVKKAGNIVLGGAIIPNTDDSIPVNEVVELPLADLYDSVLNFGYYSPNVDSRTGKVKSFVPEYELYGSNGEKKVFKHFSIALLQAYYSRIYQKNYIDFSGNTFHGYELKPNYTIPYASGNRKDIYINFISTPKPEESRISYFPSYSFLDVYNGNIDPKVFQGKIVLVGATAKALPDTFITPNGIEYGVFVLGNIVNTIFTKHFLMDFPKTWEWVLIYLLLLISVYFNLSRSGYVLVFSNFALVIIFLIIFPLFIFLRSSFLLNYVFELFFALIMSLIVANIIKYLLENKDKKKLSSALSEYVSKAIANEIITSKGDINLNGEEKELVIFFSDIEGFTSVSEQFTPQTLVAFLREYLQEMSTIILDNEGFINKYEGDAIMGLWGTFTDQQDKYILACQSALAQQRELKRLNRQWSKIGLPDIRVRIGLHSGQAIVGNIGAQGRKMEYTALGDNVNLASRLEGVNKFYGTYMCVSEDIYDKTKNIFEYRFLDEIKVKGKSNSIKIYELIDEVGKVSDVQLKQVQDFEEAYTYYKAGKISAAKEIFEKLVKMGDIPSNTYLHRCEIFISDGIPEDWDGIWTFDKK